MPRTSSMSSDLNGRPGWVGVGVDFIQEWLDNFWVMDQTSIHPPTVRDYINAQNKQHELRSEWPSWLGGRGRRLHPGMAGQLLGNGPDIHPSANGPRLHQCPEQAA